MDLKLNLPDEYVQTGILKIPFYKEYCGKNVEQMPKLITEGRVPMNTSQLMQRRLDFRNGSEAVKTAWMDNHFDTGDAVVYHPNGDVKIVLDSQTLRDITPNSELRDGALVLTEEDYTALQGEEFEKGELGKVNDRMTREDVKSHPVWKVLARDQGLLNDYADYIFAEGKKRFGYNTAMGVYPDSAGDAAPKMRAWYVDGLEHRSSASGGCDLIFGDGLFLGIVPEALSAPDEGASNIKAYTGKDLRAAKNQLTALENFLKPESLEKVKFLIGKLQ